MAKRKAQGGGAPEWLVTFADLMSLLVCFFVLIISFSIQDKQKMQVVAGSMREAFGVKKDSRLNGMIEMEGAPVREFVKTVSAVAREEDSDFAEQRHDQRRKQGPESNTHDVEKTEVEFPRQFASAAVSLRQAWQELPEISELSKNIIVQETEEGLNIQLVDQDGRSMFPEGGRHPYEFTRALLIKMAPVIGRLPNRVEISGHTSSGQMFNTSGYDGWDLSADRANTIRSILTQHGVSHDQIFAVTGKSDTEPLFPNDPFLAANRRINVLLMAESPPLPPDLRP